MHILSMSHIQMVEIYIKIQEMKVLYPCSWIKPFLGCSHFYKNLGSYTNVLRDFIVTKIIVKIAGLSE